MHTAKQWKVTLRLFDAVMAFIVLGLLALVTKWYVDTGAVRAPISFASLLWFVVWLALRNVAKKKKEEAERAEATSAQPSF